MAPQTQFVSKTQHYLKVKKPLLERQRRARMNKCLDALKEMIAEFQGNDSILRLDRAEMMEAALEFMKTQVKPSAAAQLPAMVPMDSFRNGYMNAVNEVSRVMAATPGMNVNTGKAVMVHLGAEFNRLLQTQTVPVTATTSATASSSSSLSVSIKAPLSPVSSGYCSDSDDQQSQATPDFTTTTSAANNSSVWRPW